MRWIAPAASAAFVLALVVLVPLRMALGWSGATETGLSARRATGTVWSGRLIGAAYHGISLGDARVSLDILGLGLRVAADGEARGRGILRASGVSHATAALPLARLAPGLPLTGELRVEDLSVDFGKGACRKARGRVALQDVRLGGAAGPVPGLRLAGQAACRDGRFLLPLAGEASGVAIDVLVRLDGAGRYEAVSRLRATDPLALAAAGAAGFERGLDGFSRTDRGTLGAVR
ncbi:type II secretion system protein N [Phenylobacterium sp.]|uniref:type II secretion system protein N n=1 Tax=Phenylobacterium sp. TaxID=1871053 RepID=UPI00391AB80B